MGILRTVADMSLRPDRRGDGAPGVVGIHNSGLPAIVTPLSNTPARRDLWKMIAFAFNDGAPPSSVSIMRNCKSRCQFEPKRPELAILARPSSTISTAVCLKALTAADVATDFILLIISAVFLSTLNLNRAAI